MRSVRLCILALGLLVGREIAEAAERPERRPIGRLGAGVQLGGFYDLLDPGIEFRGWAKRVGLSLSLGRHVAERLPGVDRPAKGRVAVLSLR